MSDITDGLCQCGCGRRTTIATRTLPERGHVNGQPTRYITGHNCRTGRRSATRIGGGGYIEGTTDGGRSYQGEHVLVAERVLGRPLPTGACVHHVDFDKTNNDPSNLVICESASYHAIIHARLRALRACGDPGKRSCSYCHEWDHVENMSASSARHLKYRHKACAARYARDRRRNAR